MLAREKTERLLRPALAEFILVVVGILLALQIDNWNQQRNEQREIADYALALIRDVERDLIMVAPIQREIHLLHDKIEGLATYMQGRSIGDISNVDLFYLMREPYYRPYAWNRTALEQIKSSGALRQMRDRLLAEKISAYDALTRHLDEDFAYDRRVGGKSMELASGVVDMNYPNVHDVVNIDASDSYAFPDSPVHQAYEDLTLPLLTSDVILVRVAVNSYLELGGGMGIRPRIEIEIPRLLADAHELIELLTAEYTERH
jgi:uncharacterized protein DUF6090